MLKLFDEKVEAAIKKMASERDTRKTTISSPSGSMKSYYSAGIYNNGDTLEEMKDWYSDGGWHGHHFD